MAPSAIETSAIETSAFTGRQNANPTLKVIGEIGSYKELSPIDYEKVAEEKSRDGFGPAKIGHVLPSPITRYPTVKPLEHFEHGLDAGSRFPAFVHEGVTVTGLTPIIGTEVVGTQLSSLDATGKDQLARLVAECKVVVFRERDFAHLPTSKALEFGGYFDRHHIHPASGSAEGYPEIHLVHRSAGDQIIDKFFENRTSTIAWHSDVSYKEQPPGMTFLYILDKPETGGDNVFVNHVKAYNRLSPAFQQRLPGLKALHSGDEQVEASKARGSILRREPVINEHPIVRTHPVMKGRHFT